MYKKITFSILLVSLTACGSSKDITQVTSLQKTDKNLSCQEILLEVNDANFYRKVALKKKQPKISSVILPIGYMSTYMKSENAIDAASARVEYLQEIYKIMSCDGQNVNRQQNVNNNNQYYNSYQQNQPQGQQNMGQIESKPSIPHYGAEPQKIGANYPNVTTYY